MIFIIRSIETKEIHEASRFQKEEGQPERVWANTWPGEHVIGQDAEWVEVTGKEWEFICYVRENPEKTTRQIAKATGLSYDKVRRQLIRFCLSVRIERVRGEVKSGKYWKKYCEGN